MTTVVPPPEEQTTPKRLLGKLLKGWQRFRGPLILRMRDVKGRVATWSSSPRAQILMHQGRTWVGSLPRRTKHLSRRVVADLSSATGRRWVDLLGLMLVALVLSAVMGPLLLAAGNVCSGLLEKVTLNVFVSMGACVGYLLTGGALIILCSLLLGMVVSLGGLRVGHFASFWRYPPAWAAAVIVSVLTQLPKGHILDLVLSLAMLTFAGAIAVAYDLCRTKCWDKTDDNERSLRISKLANTSEETLECFEADPTLLIEWIDSNAAVRSIRQDLFEARHTARIIARKLTGKNATSICVYGEQGVGKSTVLNLMESYLCDPDFKNDVREQWKQFAPAIPPRILVCRVQAWGFTKEPAASVVLREAVKTLAKQVDCLAIRNLPTQYHEAIKAVGPAWMRGPLAFLSPGDPLDQLRRLGAILLAINARLVLVVEDLDRNESDSELVVSQQVHEERGTSTTESAHNVTAHPGADLLTDVQAMLDRLADVPNVCLVIAWGQRHV